MTWSRQLFQFVLCVHPTPRCWTSRERELSSRVGLFQSRLCTLRTYYHLRWILPYCGHLQTTLQDPSVQTVLTWFHQRLCVFGLYGAIQMLLLLLYYYLTPCEKWLSPCTMSKNSMGEISSPVYRLPGHCHIWWWLLCSAVEITSAVSWLTWVNCAYFCWYDMCA